MSIECACTNGRPGAQTCSSSEVYGKCVCANPQDGHDAGDTVNIRQDDTNKDVDSDTQGADTELADASSVDTADVDTADVDTADVDTADVDTADVDTADVDTADVDTADVDSADVDTTDVGTTDVDTADAAADLTNTGVDEQEPLENILGLVAGAFQTCFWLGSGEVLCTGAEGGLYQVQELAGPAIHVSTPGTVDRYLSPHFCAVLEDGAVQCWGENDRGQLGDGSETNSSYAIDVVGVTEAVEVQTSARSSCARTQSGGVRCWGQPFWGQANTVVSSGAIELALGYSYLPPSVASDEESYPYMFALLDTGDVLYFTDGEQAGEAIEFPSPAIQIAIALYGVCAVLQSHEVYCASDATEFEPPSAPRKIVGLPDTIQIAANDGVWIGQNSGSACALGVDGKVYCWQTNTYGQLGIGTSSDDFVDSLDVQPVEGVADAVSVSVGDGHACALLADGTAKCWGRNETGQLGDHSLNDRSTPVAVLR